MTLVVFKNSNSHFSIMHTCDFGHRILCKMADSSHAPTILPPWQAPSPPTVTHDVGLYIMNSLTREKEKFVTIDGGSNVRWYM